MQRMRVLTMILGTVSLTGTVFIGANWANANSEAGKAAAGYQRAQMDIESLNGLHESEQHLENSILHNLEEHVGGQKGARELRAEATKNISGMRETLSRLGEQQDIASANQSSLVVYSAVIQRDIHLAYLLGALWVAFGFAWALVPKK